MRAACTTSAQTTLYGGGSALDFGSIHQYDAAAAEGQDLDYDVALGSLDWSNLTRPGATDVAVGEQVRFHFRVCNVGTNPATLGQGVYLAGYVDRVEVPQPDRRPRSTTCR